MVLLDAESLSAYTVMGTISRESIDYRNNAITTIYRERKRKIECHEARCVHHICR